MSAHLHLHLQRRSRHRQDGPHLLHRQATGRLAHARIRCGVSGLRGGQLAPRVPPLRRGLVIHQDPACGRAQDKIGPALHMLAVGRSPRDSQFDHGDGRWPAGCQPRTQSAQLVVERCSVHVVCGLHPLQNCRHFGPAPQACRRRARATCRLRRMRARCTRIVRKALAVVRPQFRLDFADGIHGLPHRSYTMGAPAIVACWDTDGLALARVGIEPEPARLCTEPARHAQTIDAAVRLAIGKRRAAQRRIDYFEWAREVVDGCRLAHAGLAATFDELYARREPAAPQATVL